MKPVISVVIPAHNRPGFLEKTLKALLEQDLRDFEVLAVGFKGKNTIKLVKKKFKDKKVKFFNIDSRFPDKKRNFGIKKARAGIIAFTDDDCLPDKNWLSEIAKIFRASKSLAGVEGLTYNNNKKLYFHATENLKGGKFPACNYAFRKKWLERVGGFDEEYNFFREDTDLAFKVLKAGGKIVFDRNARVFHPPRALPLHFPLKELKMVKGDIRLYKKFPRLYRQHFGLPCRSPLKQSLFTALAFFAMALSFSHGFFAGFVLAVLAEFLFKYAVEMRKKEFTPFQGLSFVFFSFLRDLFFGYVFFYYLFFAGWGKILRNFFHHPVGFH